MRKAISVGVLCLACLMSLSAATAVEELHALFEEALAAGKPGDAVECYEELQKEVAREARSALMFREEARKAGNKVVEAEQEEYLAFLRSLRMNEAETDALLSLILETGEEEYAAWLYLNSEYYEPALTLDWSSSGDSLASSSLRVLSVQPGATLYLPTALEIKLPLSRAGLLKGWGTLDGELLYEPGTVVKMPLESMTLYAVWTPAVSFFDAFSGLDVSFEGLSEGEALSVPELDERYGYIFAGWWDRTSGAYISPDETETVLVGNGAFYEALWIKLEVKNLMARRYAGTVPSNKPVEFAFVLRNDGTERMKDITVEFLADTDKLVLNRNVFHVDALSAGKDMYLSGLNIVADGEGEYGLTAKVTDGYGHEWEYPFTIQAK